MVVLVKKTVLPSRKKTVKKTVPHSGRIQAEFRLVGSQVGGFICLQDGGKERTPTVFNLFMKEASL